MCSRQIGTQIKVFFLEKPGPEQVYYVCLSVCLSHLRTAVYDGVNFSYSQCNFQRFRGVYEQQKLKFGPTSSSQAFNIFMMLLVSHHTITEPNILVRSFFQIESSHLGDIITDFEPPASVENCIWSKNLASFIFFHGE